MTGFSTINGRLSADAVPLPAIAEAAGTPAYVYSASLVRERYRSFDRAFAGHPHAVHVALKANSTLAIVRLLHELGADMDANSIGEIAVARRAGVQPSEIVFAGVGKTDAELSHAIALGIKAINAESPGELERVADIARAQRTTARVALRVNPDVDAKSHPHISTGLKQNKFGVPLETVPALPRAWLTETLPGDWRDRCKALGCVALDAKHTLLSADVVRGAHAAGLRVAAWTVNDPERAAELASWGVDTVITDAVDVIT